MSDQILGKIRMALGRSNRDPIAPRPAILPSRAVGSETEEIETFYRELNKVSATGDKITLDGVSDALKGVVDKYTIKKAALWRTSLIAKLGIAELLRSFGVEIVENNGDKHVLSECDLGITEVSFVLPETGTIVLRASEEMPRVTSLLPRVHLAIAVSGNLRADLTEVFEETKGNGYFVFITGPSRTADIEMTTALGVHGPRELVVWMLAKD